MLQEAGTTNPPEISDEQVRQQILQERLTAQDTTPLMDGEREIVESALIDEIAAQNEISPDLLSNLRALGFEGSNEWTQEEIAQNMKVL